jgi:hypothetical protein
MTWLVITLAVLGALLAVVTGFRHNSPKAIALWEILGGGLFLLLMAVSVAQGSFDSLGPLYVLSALLVAFVAVTSGVLLWQNHTLGIKLSIIAQAWQAAWISLPLVQFGATLGPTLGLRVTATTITFNMGFYVRGGVLLMPPDAAGRFPLDITVNGLAVLAVVALWRLHRVSVPFVDAA